MTHAASRYLSWQVLVVVSLVGVSSAATAQTVVPAYAGSYSLQVVGSIPGLPAPYGGLRFLDPNTILIGGAANTPSGRLYTIDVTRDAGGHITGFVGTAATTRYNQNELGQTKPGSLDEETFGVPFNFFFLSAGQRARRRTSVTIR